MDVRSLGFRTDLALLAVTGSEIEDRGTHLVVRTPANPNYRWGNFLLLAERPVPGGEREVLAAFDAEFPQARHTAIGIDGTEDQSEHVAAFVEAGLQADSAVVMTATGIDAPPHSTEAEIRPLVTDEDWEARVLLSRDVDPDEDPDDVLAFARGKVVQERTLVDAGHGQRCGAFVDGRLLSTAGIFRIDAGLARFQSVETHPDARRQGLAANVVHAAARHALDDLGVRTLVMVADPDADAIRIYRALGFADTERMLQLEQRP